MKIRIVIMMLSMILFSSCTELDAAFSRSRPASSVKNAKSFSINSENQSDSLDSGNSRDPIKTKYGTYYFLKKGDDLGALTKQYRLTFEEVARINRLTSYEVGSGRRIFFPNASSKEKYLQGTTLLLQAQHSENEVSDVVTQKVSDSKKTIKLDKGSLSFVWPVEGGGVVTSRFGWRRNRRHDGVDISSKVGTGILAVADGKVIFAERFAGYGNLIVLQHAGNYFTAYAHASTLYVEKDARVKQGQRISAVGSTGRSTGPHLHFEVRKKTEALDPLTVLPIDSAVRFVNLSTVKKAPAKKRRSTKKAPAKKSTKAPVKKAEVKKK